MKWVITILTTRFRSPNTDQMSSLKLFIQTRVWKSIKKGPKPNIDHWLYVLAADEHLNNDLSDNKKYPDLMTCPILYMISYYFRVLD